jgi:hypothetical protein
MWLGQGWRGFGRAWFGEGLIKLRFAPLFLSYVFLVGLGQEKVQLGLRRFSGIRRIRLGWVKKG